MNLEISLADSLEEVTEAEWQSLLDTSQPFCSYSFLRALETSGSLATEKGWGTNHALVYDGTSLVAALPSYIKTNSHGEFVYDWVWAEAYERYGVSYYPKMLTGIPYSPITGPRLLCAPGALPKGAMQSVINKLADHCTASDLSSWHINFIGDYDRQLFAENENPFLFRYNWQFHWPNRGYTAFDEFLATLKRRKRNNIRRERSRVRDAGITIECLHGDELTDEQLEFIIRCYRHTFLMKGNYPALTDKFFEQMRIDLGNQFLVMLAVRDSTSIAAAIFFRDDKNLYGRYWGAIEVVPDLHFEMCYYQGIEYCIRHGLSSFQPGAGGEYKIARGFLPVKTWSAHLIRKPEFHAAIRDFLAEEDRWLNHYYQDVMSHSPYQDTLSHEAADHDTQAS